MRCFARAGRQVKHVKGFALIKSNVPDLSGKSILLIEDNILIAMEVETALEEAGAEVHLCTTIGAGITAIRERPVDFLLTDHMLTDADSKCAIAAAIAHGVPYAVLTGYDFPPNDPSVAGAKIFAKPCPADEIVAYIEAQLSGAASQRSE